MANMEKYLVTEKKGKISPAKIKKAVEEADMAFWATVADFLPEVETGDLDPSTTRDLIKAMEKAVTMWVKYNYYEE